MDIFYSTIKNTCIFETQRNIYNLNRTKMEDFLLNLLITRLPKNVDKSFVSAQLELAGINLNQIGNDLAHLLEFEISDTLNLSQNDIRNRQIMLNITDQFILGLFDNKQKSINNNGMPKLRDRVKIAKQLSEIKKINSFNINNKLYQRPSFTSKSQIKFRIDTINNTDYITRDIHSSQMDLNDLKQIFLKNMTVNKIHFGEYLECIVIEVPFNKCGLHLVVKDIQDDQIENVILFNYYNNESIKINSKLIIKEPYLQTVYGTDSENECFIRIDSPIDVVQVESKNITNNNESVGDETTFYSMAKSAYSMRLFETASEYYSKCLKLDSLKLHYDDLKLGLDKTNARLNEAKTGIYDLDTLMRQYLENETFNFDIADYQSNLIEIADIKNKSKGI